MNYLAIIVATLVAFIASSIWYICFSKAMTKLNSNAVKVDMKKSPHWMKMAEFARSFVVAFVLASLIVALGINSWANIINLGLLLWIGFPFILLTGSVMWEKVNWKLAAIHSGDWFIKIFIMLIILHLWR